MSEFIHTGAPVSGLRRSRGSKMTLSVLQYRSTPGERHVALMDAEGIAWRLAGIANVRALARAALDARTSLAGAAQAARSDEKVDLGTVTLLAPIDHEDPAHLLMTGTGLTHLGSAESRDAMHRAAASTESGALTDSMRMFLMGVDGG